MLAISSGKEHALRTRTIVLIVVLVAACIGLYGVRISAEDDNSQLLEFVSACLRNQEAACGASLEVEYTRVAERTDADGNLLERGEKRYRYIRTPAALRADTLVDGELVHVAFHDRITNAWRELSFDGSRCVAAEGRGLGDPFLDSHFFETSRYLLEKKPLVEWIPSATVVAPKEILDGEECLRLHITNVVSRPSGFDVWLDPAISYNPRRIDIVIRPGDVVTVRYEQYESLPGGVWFPKKMTVQSIVPKYNWNVKVVNTVTKVSVGKTYTVEKLRPAIPSGAEVHALGGEYTQP